VALVGPTGVGKTTTIAKIASRFVMRYGATELALITTDCYKIGAQEQLRTFADLIGVPVYVANTQGELYSLLDALNQKRLVLIDTAGMSQRDLQLSQQLTSGHLGADKVRNYLVLSAATQLNVMRDIVNSFGKVVLKGCILTKLDEALQLGNVITVLIESSLSMAYVSVGQKVPEDLQKVQPAELVDRAVMLGQQNPVSIDDQLYRMGMLKELANGQ
jgi:flagellar biosynthesis protein FlhF